MKPVRATRAALAAVAVAVLAVAGCSSKTAAEQAGTVPAAAGSSAAAPSLVPPGVTDVLADAKKRVADSLSGGAGFTPPATGPAAQKKGGTIAYVAADLTNGGVNTVGKAVTEAGAAIGWKVDVIDGKGSAQGRTSALNQAIALKPVGIVLGGFDATEQSAAIKQATDLGIPVVGWHAGPESGPIASAGLFNNVTTDPLQVSWLAAAYAIAQSDGKAGVAVFTDSQYQIAVRKADAMRDYVKLCTGCSVLSYEDSPIAEADSRMPALISSLLQQHGDKLTYLLAINGNYFGGAKSALRDAGKPAAGPPYSVAAGDGDAAEFQRIRTSDYQAATVAEPMPLQGWQLVDELNRAIAKQPASGFVAMPALITKDNVPSGDVFDPSSGYRDIYKKIWAGA
jgi:ribose transport system substrate-binding protein